MEENRITKNRVKQKAAQLQLDLPMLACLLQVSESTCRRWMSVSADQPYPRCPRLRLFLDGTLDDLADEIRQLNQADRLNKASAMIHHYLDILASPDTAAAKQRLALLYDRTVSLFIGSSALC